ncbi:uncharacterized protein LOC123315053 [Coccinella septempunctata]|uniref:uncharacterized protein LOC123315053 n=1 Tax=Coccinella septempunctata TaxID=41139 RepID=UPI001D07D719|nr:uncharacterized protein LOC123315053 [Coccinella septempunctata]
MSGIDVQRCEIEKIEKDPLDSKNILTAERKSNTVAVELLNDIVENALDSVLTDEGGTRNVCMVGDIVDQFTPRATKLTDLYDTSSDIKNRKILTSTEEEVKKFIGEISSPSTKGTGDQLGESEEIVAKKKSFTFSSRNFTLEKKTRLTDLVKNSKSLISKFLSIETKSKDSEWEEHSEEFVKCIELDQINAKEKRRTLKDQNIRSVTPSHSGEMIRIPDETGMENINLKDIKGTAAEQSFEVEMDHVQKSMTFPIASCSKIPSTEHEGKESLKDKKKWSLGSRIVNYIKKRTSKRDVTKSEV